MIMKLLASFTALGLVLAASTPAFAQSQAADPDTAQFMCDLTGECGAPAAAPATAAEPQPGPSTATTPQRRTSSNTRGFSFRRAGQNDANATAPTAVATTQTVARPSQLGQTNMGLTFVPGSATLTEQARARLARYAVALQSPQLASRRLRIEGHTDATGSTAVNEALSRQRAQAAADFLASVGVNRSRLEVVGYGSRRPLTATAPNAAANRRVMAVLL